MVILRLYWRVQGEHVHLRVFTGDEYARSHEELRHAGNVLLTAAEFIQLSQGNLQTEFQEEEER